MKFQSTHSLGFLLLLTCSLHGGTTRPAPTAAAEPADQNSEGVLEKFFRPALNLRYTYDADMDFDKLHGGLSLQEAEITLPMPPLVTGELTVLGDLYYRYYQLDVDTPNYKADLDLHTVRVPIQALWKAGDSPWFVYAFAAPGVSSDFHRTDSDAFDITASMNLGYQFSSDLVLAGGIYYTRDYGDDVVLPSIGILWSPTQELSVSVTAAGAAVTYAFNDDWRVKLKAIPYGGRWIVNGNSGQEKVELAGAKIGADLEHRICPQCWIGLGAGVNVFSNLRVESANGRVLVDDDLDPSLYVTGSFRWSF